MTDYILAMHKHAHDNIEDGVSYNDMDVYLRAKGFKTSNHKDAIIRAYGDIFFSPSDGDIGKRAAAYTGNASRTRHHMAPEAYFRYLSYLEYQQANENALEAQQSSRRAINYAKWALVLSALIGVAQIYVALYYR